MKACPRFYRGTIRRIVIVFAEILKSPCTDNSFHSRQTRFLNRIPVKRRMTEITKKYEIENMSSTTIGDRQSKISSLSHCHLSVLDVQISTVTGDTFHFLNLLRTLQCIQTRRNCQRDIPRFCFLLNRHSIGLEFLKRKPSRCQRIEAQEIKESQHNTNQYSNISHPRKIVPLRSGYVRWFFHIGSRVVCYVHMAFSNKRSFALRARGLRSISSVVGTTGFRLRRVIFAGATSV